MSVASTQSTLKAYLSFVDLRVCQRSVAVVSNLVKDVYSCKNVIKRGKKRKFFKALIKQASQRSAEKQAERAQYEAQLSSFEVSVDFRKVRVVFYDSVEIEAKKTNDSNSKT